MKNLILAAAFCFTATFATASTDANNTLITSDSEIETPFQQPQLQTNEAFATCTVTVRGEDEWGCAYTHTYTYTGDISYAECQELGSVVKFLYALFM